MKRRAELHTHLRSSKRDPTWEKAEAKGLENWTAYDSNTAPGSPRWKGRAKGVVEPVTF